ncbi:helix-turn-helix transcriptional regulator [Shewanella psychropiezotolerans]|uniref:Helix-turn-helix transcriptional regulator n=1 Tax=Shewanella psychropiezotolerans TaxID=2593655 RepID=A0ABX5X5Y3_9GAMM|nr:MULTISPECIES: AraC family transcriptional regulator [Shewanella]MPY25688.1 helix-turn-helix transcriptional regulator [Shewanella sp. YLB-07]QDO86343.1 helix-turn-helix transcriptional regulator [Shewanella psychropiezotolerans]
MGNPIELVSQCDLQINTSLVCDFIASGGSEVKTIQDDVLLYVQVGAITIQSADETLTIQAGEAGFIRRGEYLFEYFSDTSAGKVETISVFFNTDFLKSFVQRHAETLASFVAMGQQSRVVAKLSINELVKQTLDGLFSVIEFKLPGILYELKLEELLLLIVHSSSGGDLCRLLRQQANRSSDRLHAFMEKYYLKEWKLSEYAREFGASLTTFKELFHEVFGVSPRAWITERRLLYAYNLLLSSETRIVDIAIEAGFSSQSYFTQSYRRRFGITPSKVRSQLSLSSG